MKNKCCSLCGAKMVEYKHTFSKALAVGLSRLYDAGEPINIKDLNLTRNQWDNFQKLRYWDLVRKGNRGDGTRIGGVWGITPDGRNFIEGRSFLPKQVWTYRGSTLRFGIETCKASDYLDINYKTSPGYAEDAVPHNLEQGLMNGVV